MVELVKPAAFTLASWAGLFFIFSGVGLLALKMIRSSHSPGLFRAFWLGWAFTLAILQVWHLFLPVNWLALCFVWLLGMIGLFLHWRALWDWLKSEARERRRFWLVAGLAALWFANLAAGPSAIYDTGLYHVQSVKWAASYPIVPGLGNLHGRLAYNSSYFLYAALLDTGEWAGRAHHIAGGLLLAVMLVYSLRSLSALFSARGADRIYHLFYAFLLAPIVIEASGGTISTFSGDLPAFALGIVISGELLRFLLGSGHRQDWRLGLLSLAMLTCAGIAVNLGFAVLGITALAIALAAWLLSRPARKEILNAVGGIAVAFFILLVPWMARGVILSGYPFFPSVFGGFDVPWRVPRSLVLADGNWIRSWPRTPSVFWADVLANWNWLKGWVDRLPQDVLRALGIAMAAGLCAVFAPKSAEERKISLLPLWAFLLPPTVWLASWFASSPNPGAAMFAFWSLAAGSVALTLGRSLPRELQNGRAQSSLLVATLAFFVFLSPVRTPLIVAPGEDAGFHPIENTAYQPRTTHSNLVVNMPQSGDRCGNAPLPCTPYYRANLNSVLAFGSRQGFRLDDSIVYMDTHGASMIPDPSLPPGLSILYRTGWLAPDSAYTTMRWTSTPSTILMYTAKAQVVKLLLTPFKMNVRGNFGDVGLLRVRLNGKVVGTWTVRKDVTSEITLRLRRDYNQVTFEYLGGNFVPKESGTGSVDERSLAIGFYPIVIVPAE